MTAHKYGLARRGGGPHAAGAELRFVGLRSYCDEAIDYWDSCLKPEHGQEEGAESQEDGGSRDSQCRSYTVGVEEQSGGNLVFNALCARSRCGRFRFRAACMRER